MNRPESNDQMRRRAGGPKLTASLLSVVISIALLGGCALYREGEPADSKYHLIQGESAHYEKVLEFYIATSEQTSTALPTDQVNKLFEGPVWSAPPGVQLTATSVGTVDPATLHWKDLHLEYEISGYRLRLVCDCTVLPDASESNGAITVQFPKLKSDLGRDRQNNPRYARFVSDYNTTQPTKDNTFSIIPIKTYPSRLARFVNLYSPWLIVVAIGVVVLFIGWAQARWRRQRIAGDPMR